MNNKGRGYTVRTAAEELTRLQGKPRSEESVRGLIKRKKLVPVRSRSGGIWIPHEEIERFALGLPPNSENSN